MNKIEICFSGGVQLTFTEVGKEVVEDMIEWLDNKENTDTFQINTPKKNTKIFLRKDLILFINVG